MNVWRLLAIKTPGRPELTGSTDKTWDDQKRWLTGSTRSNIKFDVAPGVFKQPSCELRMAYDHDVRSAAMKLDRMKGFFVAAFLKETR